MNREQPPLFFSIVVPAHNEEKYIGETLTHLVALDYPKDRYEVIVVENGSTDATLKHAQAFETKNIRVVSYGERGVSFARNRGTELAQTHSNWIVYLDADTFLEPIFLRELADYLELNKEQEYVVGTSSVRPEPSSFLTEIFFLWINFVRSFKKVPSAIFFIRMDIAKRLTSNDEEREVGEDVALCKSAEAYGSTFFLSSPNVTTSIRRFEKVGWIRSCVYWLLVIPLPSYGQRFLSYKVIR